MSICAIISFYGCEILAGSQLGQSEWIYQFLVGCGINEGVIFEAGAASPNSISNSEVFRNNGYKVLLCEANEELYEEWNSVDNSRLTIVNNRIKYDRKGLEELLHELQAPFSLEALFLDIDGGEYQLLEGLDCFRPKLICVEYDNAYPLNIDYIPLRTRHGMQQASSLAMFKLMRSKGYKYLKSFFQDHIFIAEEFVSQHLDTIDRMGVKYGDELFFDEAPKHLYNLSAVCVNQSEGSGDAGINFYSWQLRNLISSEYLLDAKNFYCHLCASFDALIPQVETRGDAYFSQYMNALETFRSSYLWLVRC